MDKVTVLVGSVVAGSSGQTNDNTQEAEFEAEELASRTEYGLGRGGGITDSRGVTETLYKTSDGRLVVHVEGWSNWQGEPNTYTLHEVTEADLGVAGQWAALGAEAGYGRPLTLDEAISPVDRLGYEETD
ncbi:MAG TPA: hypothetical protein G4N99_08645 [Thermoflexia bacterium]|nr:hypothetical protein [Thermoflexia bacterium]